MKSIWIQDTSLRDGLQAPGVRLGNPGRLRIAHKLASCGVDELEAGIPAVGGAEDEFIQDLMIAYSQIPSRQWCRAKTEDLQKAVLLGCRRVHISIPASSVILDTLGWSWERALEIAENCLNEWRSRFDSMTLGFQDIARAPVERMGQIGQWCQERELEGIRLADTVGLLDPWGMEERVAAVSKEYNGRIEVHVHNDLGLATANALAALRAGADALSGTLGGVGERAGNLRLEELLPWVCGDFDTAKWKSGLHSSRLLDVAGEFLESIGRETPVDRPLTGAHVFHHCSGIHIHSLKKDPNSYQPFDPRTLGNRMMSFGNSDFSGRHKKHCPGQKKERIA